MKKFVLMTMLLSAVLFAVSCGDSVSKDTGDTVTDSDVTDTGDVTTDKDTGDTTDSTVDDDTADSVDSAVDDDSADSVDSAVDDDTADSVDSAVDDDTADSVSDDDAGDTVSEECVTCAASNRKCEEKDGTWICTACMDLYYEDNHICEPKGSLGAACDDAGFSGEDCGSGNCVDGLCCDTDCTGLCSACNVTGNEGSCAPIPADTDPDDECAPAGASTCGTNGMCDGAGACALYDASTICQDANCTDGTHSEEAAFCDGTGTCDTADLEISNCSPYTCNGTTGTCTAGTCKGHADCDPDYFCNEAGNCERDLGTGQRCTNLGDDACVSGYCIEDNFPAETVPPSFDSYCLDAANNCAKNGAAKSIGTEICYDTRSFKTCDSPDLWSFPESCPQDPNKTVCTPAGWKGDAGYHPTQQLCSDTGTRCSSDTSCLPCRVDKGKKDPLWIYYHFDTTKHECLTTCVYGKPTPVAHHTDCSQPSLKVHYYCALDDVAYPDQDGWCIPQKDNNIRCLENYECKSNKCLQGAFTRKKYCTE